MLNVFMAGPGLVRSELTALGANGPYRLTISHGQGSIVEYFLSSTAALLREAELEQLLISARGAQPGAERSRCVNATPSRVLIIDDDEAVTQTFAGILRLEGHEVRTALDAESGLEQADMLPPDAIIVDLRMPLINGLGFLYRLRERECCRYTPVAIVTADYTLDESIPRELAELGAQVYFKPLWLEDVVDLAYSLLGSEGRDGSRRRTINH